MIRSLAELKSVLDAEETALYSEMLDHGCWVVEQRWVSEAGSLPGEVYGPFASGHEALAACEARRAHGVASAAWTARYGQPVTRVVPVFPVEDGAR